MFLITNVKLDYRHSKTDGKHIQSIQEARNPEEVMPQISQLISNSKYYLNNLFVIY